MALPTIQRPTISLALIVKNEEKNLNRLLDSVEGCFDEIVLVDTGSTDKTKEIANHRGCKVLDFVWVDSFCKARNFAFQAARMDYICWLDADDILFNRDNFIHWRDYAMEYADCWFNTYEYAVEKETLKPIINFVRERVLKRSVNPTWQYDLHEGIIAKPEWSRNFATTWSVKHLRDAEDMAQDKSRNINMLEKIVKSGQVDGRMQFYYGKELHEAGRHADAIHAFDKAFEMKDLQAHDRILGLQTAGYAALACIDQLKPEFQEERLRYADKAITFAQQGIKLDSNRAEFYVMAADAYLRIGNIQAAVPYFASAKACLKNFDTPFTTPLYHFKNLYGEAPSLQLAKIYMHLGLLDKAKKEAKECAELYQNEEAKNVASEIERITDLVRVDNNQEQTEDILITCPPQSAYEFDEELYKTKGMGGSETALIQMAKFLRVKTNRRVLVYAMRKEKLIGESGVEYIPNSELTKYISKFKPRIHIAWRHNIKVTNAPTYLWCHDLFTPGVESAQNFDKFLALSPFHKNYTMGLQGVSEDKIIVTRNGIVPEKFAFEKRPKNPNKLVWMSSPDRGLERAMLVADKVREKFPDIELHVYYGIEGLYKYGPQMSALADRLKSMMATRSYVHYHGFTEQSQMMEEVSDAVIWLHPNNFIETFCITALECLANGIFPVVRRLGALSDTLKDAEGKGQAILLDYKWDDESSIDLHAGAVVDVLQNKRWENVSLNLPDHAWEKVADEWIEFMHIGQLAKVEAS